MNKTISNLETILDDLLSENPTTCGYFIGDELFIDNDNIFQLIEVYFDFCQILNNPDSKRTLTDKEKLLYSKLFVKHHKQFYSLYNKCQNIVNFSLTNQ